MDNEFIVGFRNIWNKELLGMLCGVLSMVGCIMGAIWIIINYFI